MIDPCAACFSSFADFVALRVGQLFGMGQVVRLQLCRKCRLGVWTLWPVRRFFRANMPDVYVLPNRPGFTGDGRTDATEYCWAVWTPERGRKAGLVSVLAETPASERR